MKQSLKLKDLPPYIFAQLDALIHEKLNNNEEIYVLSKSDPDRPTHTHAIETLCTQARDPINHHYSDFDGLDVLRKQMAKWYQHFYGVSLDPEKEILPLQGSKEGIIHFCQAWLDPGDITLIPDPAFPSYRTGTILAGGKPYFMPLHAPDFLPHFEEIPSDIAKKAKIMFLNYPNNPTGQIASLDFFKSAVSFARENDIILINDHAYAMTTFKENAAPSLLSLPGSLDLSLEFFTFSKAFHMAGWRLGMAVGNADILQGLKVIETHVNAGIFNPIQYAGTESLKLGLEKGFFTRDNLDYVERLKILVDFFNEYGWNLKIPEATVYLWVPSPQGMTGQDFSQFLLDKAHVVVSPGIAFGQEGRNYVRFCVTYPKEMIQRAVQAMKESFSSYGIRSS
jgi:LL-diaminopimelate aminotransferase